MIQRLCKLVTIVLTTVLMMQAILAPPSFAQADADSPTHFDIGLEPVADGFIQPVGLTNAGDGSGVLYVVEKPGTIRRIVDSERVEQPFLDIRDRVGDASSEQGLLGLAFPSDYAQSRIFYVNYTDLDGNSVVSRFRVADNDIADSESEEVILRQVQPYANHNGGQIAFGPDGYLYIGFGDGGGQGDPNGNGQYLQTWLGKLLRIDVDPDYVPTGQTYGIPEDNPFVDDDSALPEIYAYGLRNPWRFSFDAENGNLMIADVGQNWIEEINVLPLNPDDATNFGWNITEGSYCYLENNCDATGITLPVMEYTHTDSNCSVTGGQVYYGDNIPALYGTYIFADYCSGLIWQGVQNADGAWIMSDPIPSGLTISSFGVDEYGEVYVVDLRTGIIYRLEAPL